MKKSLILCLFFSFYAPILLHAQSISGTIVDEQNEPLPYATIYQKNSTNGTTSNGDGEFALRLNCTECIVVFQYIGYQTLEKRINPSEKSSLNIQLMPNEAALSEVVIDGNAEDPAYRIMREAIKKRKKHLEELSDYSCEAYVKGFQKLLDAPEKILGQEIGDMGGMLDSTKQGIVYLSESVSKIYHRVNPKASKEVMMSSQVSGEPNGFSLNRANIVDLNFYNERIEVERDILSPLASNAFSYYKFKLLGYKQEDGRKIALIQVLPKRASDPVFGGTLAIETEDFHLHTAQLHLTGKNIQQPILDTVWTEQQFVPIQKGTELHWALLSQNIGFKFGVFGFKMQGFFHAIFSNYDLKPDFTGLTFGKEAFKVEDKANERDSTYWAALRPIPLTFEEKFDYKRKDSLRLIWDSPAYKDSMDRVSNKFSFGDLLFGYNHSNSKTNRYWGFQAPLNTILFNTVQGYNLSLNMFYNVFSDKERSKSTYFRPQISYGFSEKKLRGGLAIGRRFNNTNQDRIEFEAGNRLRQFDGENPVSPLVNAVHSLAFKQNFMKLYDEHYAKLSYSGRYKSGIEFKTSLGYAARQSLKNHNLTTWTKSESNTYTTNHPFSQKSAGDYFEKNTGLFANFNFRYRFGQKYLSYPKKREYYDEGKPEFFANLRLALPLGDGVQKANFSQMSLGFEQDYQSMGIGGYLEWNVQAGAFLHKKQAEFMDFQHFQGNLAYFGKPQSYVTRFLALPYYELSSQERFAEAHLQYHLQGFLFDKIPGLRKLSLREVLGFSALYTSDKKQADGLSERPELPYYEVNFGIENFGFGAFRIARFDIVQSFYGTNKGRTGFVIGIGI